MSSSDELVRGIRRIVGEADEKPTGLADAEARKAIGISRGRGLIRGDGSVSGGGAEGGGNDTSPPALPDDGPGSGDSVPGDAGNVGGGGTGGKTPISGDAADVDDGMTANSQVTEVTGTDPTSSNFTSVNFDSLAGIEYAPPDGWDSPTSEDGFAPEYTGTALTPANACGIIGCPSSNVKGFQGQSLYEASTGYTYVIGYWKTGPTSATYPPGFDILGFATCPSCGPDSDGEFLPSVLRSIITTPEAPVVETVSDWPSDGVCQIAYDHEAGGYKGFEKDTDCTAAQLTPSSCYIVRSQTQSSRYFRYCRLADGGTKITEVDSGGTPVPGTITKILDGQGNVTAFVDVALDNFYQ